MTEKLQAMENRFNEINEMLTDINIINDQEQYKKLMKELKNLTPIVEKFREYKSAESDFKEAEQMLADETALPAEEKPEAAAPEGEDACAPAARIGFIPAAFISSTARRN